MIVELSTDFIQNWMQIGFIASDKGKFQDAEAIFKGLKAARPDSAEPLIGLATNYIAAGKYAEAKDVLENQILKKDPKNEVARAYLGLTLHMSNMNNQAEDVLDSIVSHGINTFAVDLAKETLELVRKGTTYKNT